MDLSSPFHRGGNGGSDPGPSHLGMVRVCIPKQLVLFFFLDNSAPLRAQVTLTASQSSGFHPGLNEDPQGWPEDGLISVPLYQSPLCRWKEVNTVSTGPALPLPSQPGAGELETQCGGRFTYLPSTPKHPAPAALVGTAATWAALSPLPP